VIELARADAIVEAEAPPAGESTSIREFMRQIGVPARTRT
jgi:hypothetical protein